MLRGQAKQPPGVVANGVIVWLAEAEETSRLSVKTRQGDFSVVLSEIPFGKSARLLAGRVMVDRLPSTTRLTATADEQDYPAAALGKSDPLRRIGLNVFGASGRDRDAFLLQGVDLAFDAILFRLRD